MGFISKMHPFGAAGKNTWRGKEKKRVCANIHVRECGRERVCVNVCELVKERETYFVHASVCILREREREKGLDRVTFISKKRKRIEI